MSDQIYYAIYLMVAGFFLGLLLPIRYILLLAVIAVCAGAAALSLVTDRDSMWAFGLLLMAAPFILGIVSIGVLVGSGTRKVLIRRPSGKLSIRVVATVAALCIVYGLIFESINGHLPPIFRSVAHVITKPQRASHWQALSEDEKRRRELDGAIAFIRDNDKVIQLFGPTGGVMDAHRYPGQKGEPDRLDIEIDSGFKGMVAIVAVNRLPDGPQFSMLCTISDPRSAQFQAYLKAPEQGCRQ